MGVTRDTKIGEDYYKLNAMDFIKPDSYQVFIRQNKDRYTLEELQEELKSLKLITDPIYNINCALLVEIIKERQMRPFKLWE